jgi:hypothetical protein
MWRAGDIITMTKVGMTERTQQPGFGNDWHRLPASSDACPVYARVDREGTIELAREDPSAGHLVTLEVEEEPRLQSLARRLLGYEIEVTRQRISGKLAWRSAGQRIRMTQGEATEAIRGLLADGVTAARASRGGIATLIGSVNGDGTATIWGPSGLMMVRLMVG